MAHRVLLTTALSALIAGVGAPAMAQDITLDLSGSVEEGGPDHVLVPFDVPEGIAEISVLHLDESEDTVLDWGLLDPGGFRGWGGGNEEPAVVAADAASRSYLAGPITPGQWAVVIGKAKLATSPAPYRLEVTLRPIQTLTPQPERQPYAPPAPLATGARWYAGDFHVHSIESGDARPPLDEVLAFAAERGLDFIEISDHNTTSHVDFFTDAQGRHPGVLLIPGIEYTTYDGHANAIGATEFVDHKIGLDGLTIDAAIAAIAEQGALLSLNHPKLAVGDLCIGCFWAHEVDNSRIDAVEIATGGLLVPYFVDPAVELWDELCAQGHHIAAIGGSDDHRAGVDLGSFQSPIGEPTTMVFAEELSVAAILEGVKSGRTVVKLTGPDGPMIELSSSAPAEGDTVDAAATTLRARVTGGGGLSVRFVKNGAAQDAVPIASNDFLYELAVRSPVQGEDRWRVEVLDRGARVTVTSHLFLTGGVELDEGEPAPDPPVDAGCGCRARDSGGQGTGGAWLMIVAAAILATRRRRRPRPDPAS